MSNQLSQLFVTHLGVAVMLNNNVDKQTIDISGCTVGNGSDKNDKMHRLTK